MQQVLLYSTIDSVSHVRTSQTVACTAKEMLNNATNHTVPSSTNTVADSTNIAHILKQKGYLNPAMNHLALTF